MNNKSLYRIWLYPTHYALKKKKAIMEKLK